MIRICLLFLLLTLDCYGELRVQFGELLGYGLHEDGITRNRPYIFAKQDYSWECNEAIQSVEGSLRGWFDFANDDKDLEVRSLYFSHAADAWTLKIGVQEIAWGETFGLYILDLVNPRDFTDPLLNELNWIRIPTFTFNLKAYLDPWNAQVLFTPIPRNPQVPDEDEPFDVLTPLFPGAPLKGFSTYQVNRWGQDAEYGFRLGYLFDSGFDLTLYYLRHWNRNPTYSLKEFSLKPAQKRIQSIGASFSKAYETIVLRGDTVLHIRQPWSPKSYGFIENKEVWQTIIGLDYTTDSDTTFGAQYHVDTWFTDTLHWFSLQYIRPFCDNTFHFELFLFKGLNSQDVWIQPQLIYTSETGWKVSLRADILGGMRTPTSPKDGLIAPFRDKDRLLLWITKDL